MDAGVLSSTASLQFPPDGGAGSLSGLPPFPPPDPIVPGGGGDSGGGSGGGVDPTPITPSGGGPAGWMEIAAEAAGIYAAASIERETLELPVHTIVGAAAGIAVWQLWGKQDAAARALRPSLIQTPEDIPAVDMVNRAQVWAVNEANATVFVVARGSTYALSLMAANLLAGAPLNLANNLAVGLFGSWTATLIAQKAGHLASV
jgi:hypothetical protein